MSAGCVFVSFALNALFTGHILPNIKESANLSVIACAQLCVAQPTCKSFFRNSLDKRCFLVDTFVQEIEDVIPMVGVKYYSKPLPTCSGRNFVYRAKGNICYKDFMSKRSTWDEARDCCTASGGMLIKEDTELKHQFILKIGKENGYRGQWIGGYKDNFWKWLDDTRIQKTYWRKSGTDPWVWSNRIRYCWCDGAYSWDDAKGNKFRFGFLCEASLDT